MGRRILPVLLILVLFIAAGCGAPPEQPQKEPAKQEQTAKASKDAAPQKTVNQDQQESSSTTDKTAKEKNPVIPGLTAADIKLNLEKAWKLEFSGPRVMQTMAEDSGEAVDPDTGIGLECNIFEASPLHIRWVDFIIDASSAAGSVSLDNINTVTEGYFSYCATVPYDGADPVKAKQWVADNVRKATKPGNVLTTQVGPVKFEMFGTEYMRTLRIKPAA